MGLAQNHIYQLSSRPSAKRSLVPERSFLYHSPNVVPSVVTPLQTHSCPDYDLHMPTGRGPSVAVSGKPERRRWMRLALAISVFVRGINGRGREFLEFGILWGTTAGCDCEDGAGLRRGCSNQS